MYRFRWKKFNQTRSFGHRQLNGIHAVDMSMGCQLEQIDPHRDSLKFRIIS